MNKEDYIKLVDQRFESKESKEIMLKQIDRYYKAKDNYVLPKHIYKVGDQVKLSKGTLMHGTYKNIDGLKYIAKNGLISSNFIEGRGTKYPACVGVWNLKQDYLLKDYINIYSGGTIEMKSDMFGPRETKVIPFDEMKNLIYEIKDNKNCFRWYIEQTKEARFLPSLVQDNVQIGIIFNGNNNYIKNLLKGDILYNFSDKEVKEFVNPDYYDRFIIDRKNKDDFFTDRESAILFGIPSNMIEGILVGRIYEKDDTKLKEIKQLLPNSYICNLDGKVIVE